MIAGVMMYTIAETKIDTVKKQINKAPANFGKSACLFILNLTNTGSNKKAKAPLIIPKIKEVNL